MNKSISKIIIQIFIIFFFFQNLNSQTNTKRNKIENFVGCWSYKYISEDNDMLNCSFELNLEIDTLNNEKIIGKHCSIVRGGRKIDCFEKDDEYSITAHYGNKKLYVDFISSFGGKGKAKIYFDKTNNEIIWELVSYSGEHYLPKNVILKN